MLGPAFGGSKCGSVVHGRIDGSCTDMDLRYIPAQNEDVLYFEICTLSRRIHFPTVFINTTEVRLREAVDELCSK